MISKYLITAITIATLAACSHTEPLETPLAQSITPHAADAVTDQAVIADTVGSAQVGATALAWANPTTGSAGVIEQIDSTDGPDGCRGFVTSRQSLEGITRFNGVAGLSGNSWKLGGEVQ